MKKFGLGGLAVVAILAIGVVSAPVASAAPVTKACSATALVRPILGGPSCTTPVQVCPANSPDCNIKANVLARRVLGLAQTKASIKIYAVGDPANMDTASCVGNTETCSAALGPYHFGAGEVGDGDFLYQATCRWDGTQLGVLARIDCATTQDPVAPPQ